MKWRAWIGWRHCTVLEGGIDIMILCEWGPLELCIPQEQNQPWAWTGLGLPWGSDGKESACSAGDLGVYRSLSVYHLWVQKIPWRPEWLLTAIFLPGEFHGQRNLAGYSPWSHEELGTTQRLTLSLLFTLNQFQED